MAYPKRYLYTAIVASLSSVCSGGQLMLPCSAADGETLLNWTITVPNLSVHETRFISSSGSANSLAPLMVGQTEFQFLRTSLSPLRSTMEINNVTVGLNGTRVECSYGGRVMSTNIINVVENGTATLNTSSVLSLVSEQFESETVSVTLEWIDVLQDIHTYVVPEPLMKTVGNSMIQLVVPYNIRYHVKLLALLCGQNTTGVMTLHYVRCIHPLHLLLNEQLTIKAKSPSDTQLLTPFNINASLSFTCKSPRVLTGPNSSTCMEDGNWEPDPRETECKANCRTPSVNNSRIAIEYSATLEDSVLTFDCKEGYFPRGRFTAICYHNGSWIPNPTHHICTSDPARETKLELNLITIITLGLSAAVLIFVTVISCGCVCGYQYRNHKKQGTTINTIVCSPQHSSPVYESIMPQKLSWPTADEKQDIKLKNNVVYASQHEQVAAV